VEICLVEGLVAVLSKASHHPGHLHTQQHSHLQAAVGMSYSAIQMYV
jgi:hypothetical protein